MRIFRRLRRRDRSIERKLVETIASDLLRRIDDDAPVTTVAESESACCSCCAMDAKARPV